MTYLTIIIHKIDYKIFLTKFKSSINQNPASSRTGFRDTFLSIIQPLLPTLESLTLTRNIIAMQANKIAMDYGLAINTYLEKTDTYFKKIKEGNTNCMLTLSITIEKIDYQKIINEIKKSASSQNDNAILSDVLNIVEPFAAETLNTIPPAAIADLFMLLGKDKIIDLAKKYGVKLSDLSVTGAGYY
ncbi:MAG: hypothetical protein FWE14_02325 [Lachnospiraceae bacterium]|nr:hypothetical protein [Lachnospiraceae bacterium]